MPLDPSIYRLFAPKSVSEYQLDSQNLENARTTGEDNQLNLLLGRQKADEYTRGISDQNALRELQRGMAGTPEDQIPDAYMKAGRVNEAMAARKAMLERKKEQAEIDSKIATTGKTKADTVQTDTETLGKVMQQYRDNLTTVTTPEGFIRHLKAQYDDPILGPRMKAMGGEFMDAAQRVPPDPKAFLEFRDQVGMKMDDFIKNKTMIRGQDTTSATAIAGQQRQAADNAAARAVQMRGQNLADARSNQANQIAAGELSSGLPVLGVPVPTVVPWANQSNAKDANKVKAAEIARGSKEVEKDVENATKEGGVASAAKRFLELNEKVKTGGIADKFGVGRAVQSLGSDYSAMEAITAKLVPGMREPGSGTTSDRDLAMFERSTVGVDKPKETNAAIANGIIARAENAQDYAQFRQTYLEQNGTLQGADRYWKQYLNANPIFDPKSETPKINAARKPWRDHFAGASAAPSPAPALASAPAAPGKVIDFSALPTGR